MDEIVTESECEICPPDIFQYGSDKNKLRASSLYSKIALSKGGMNLKSFVIV